MHEEIKPYQHYADHVAKRLFLILDVLDPGIFSENNYRSVVFKEIKSAPSEAIRLPYTEFEQLIRSQKIGLYVPSVV